MFETQQGMVFAERHTVTMTNPSADGGYAYEFEMDEDDHEGIVYIYDYDLTRLDRPKTRVMDQIT